MKKMLLSAVCAVVLFGVADVNAKGPRGDFDGRPSIEEIKKHEENKKIVPEDFWENFNNFSKKYCGNKNHILYIDKTVDYPTLEEAIKSIKNAGGLVFLAHVFIYKWAENIYDFIDEILNNYNIDGIECYHSEFSEDNTKYLLELCRERQYFISGGIDMAIGKGNLKIYKEIIEEWI